MIILKRILKHLTAANLITGLLTLIVVGLVKHWALAYYILEFFGLGHTPFNEYIIIGFLGLITRLGLKGIVEEGSMKLVFMTMGPNEDVSSSSNTDVTGNRDFSNTNAAGGSGSSNPTGSSSSNPTASGNYGTNTTGSGNSATTGSSNTNTTGSSNTNRGSSDKDRITPDPNPAPYAPYEWDSPTEAEKYNCHPGILELFDDPWVRVRYLVFTREWKNEEYQNIKDPFKRLYDLESKIKALREESYKNNGEGEKIKKLEEKIRGLEALKEEHRKEWLPKITGEYLNSYYSSTYSNMKIPNNSTSFNFSPDRTHKRTRSILEEELSKRPKFTDNKGSSIHKDEPSNK